MTIRRGEFLKRVRQAVSQGNRAGQTLALPARGSIGYQGTILDPATRFRDEFVAAGGHAYLVPDNAAAVGELADLVRNFAGSSVLLGGGPFVDSLDLGSKLREWGFQPTSAVKLSPDTSRDAFFDADVAISGVDYLIAETGSLVVRCRPDEPRSLSLLPPVHIALAEQDQLVPDLFDVFESEVARKGSALPSCVSLITGPSKTGDIELRLVTGVHGPGEVHVILVCRSSGQAEDDFR